MWRAALVSVLREISSVPLPETSVYSQSRGQVAQRIEESGPATDSTEAGTKDGAKPKPERV